MTGYEVDCMIETIYAAVEEPRAWRRFTRELSCALGGAAVTLSLRVGDRLDSSDRYQTRLRRSFEPRFGEHFDRGLPWPLGLPDLTSGFVLGRDLRPDAEIAATSFYLEWMRPQGLVPEGPIAHVIFAARDAPIAAVAAFRRVGGVRFGRREQSALNALVPHLREAYRLFERLESAQEDAALLAEVMECLVIPLVVVASSGELVAANRAAADLARYSDVFRFGGGALRIANRHARHAMRAALARVAESGTAEVISLDRAGDRRPLAVALAPAGPARHEWGVASQGRLQRDIALSFGESEAATEISEGSLRALFGLTEAEAALVHRLADGASIAEAARARGVTSETVRAQLKQIFGKTGAHRQGQLLSLVLQTSAIRSPDLV